MVSILIIVITLNGLSASFWGLVGVMRLAEELASSIHIYTLGIGYLFVIFTTALLATIVAFIYVVMLYSLHPLLSSTIPVLALLSVISACVITILLLAWRSGAGELPILMRPMTSNPVIGGHNISINDVAVLVPAHNEEQSIAACINALKPIIPLANVFVASDGSSDETVRIARSLGCHVVDIQPNRGKARALCYALDHFEIYDRYQVVLILDADTEIDPNYFSRALPLLRDPSIAAIAGHAVTKWYPHIIPSWPMFFVAYRVRLYLILQAMFRYGQTWNYTNVSFIVPGFASMYRTDLLRNIDIDAPGLIIEDFNMTFELHHKGLGKIGYSPAARGYCHDPRSLKDYVAQVKRWNLGFWQTVQRHGVWPSAFWVSLGIFVFETLFASVFFLSLPIQLVVYFVFSKPLFTVSLLSFDFAEVTIFDVAMAIFLMDYLFTVIASIIEGKPLLLLYGLGFLALRFIDAVIALYSLGLSFFVRSDGTWVSPTRG